MPLQRPFLCSGGTREWLPCSSNELKPCLGMTFLTLKEGIAFYKAYARPSGFNMRKATTTKNRQSVVSFKYCLCNKAGFKEKKNPIKDDSYKQKEPKTNCEENKKTEANEKSTDVVNRKRLVTIVGCKVQMVLKHRKEGGYVVSIFHEGHNHPLYTPICKKFQKEEGK
ncbi:Protein FAR1-RELATED SEQUENCE 5 [Bienertia sinuspersici]